MDFYFIALLVIAAFYSIQGEKDAKRKKVFIGIYAVIIGLAFFYHAGQSIGQFVYYLTH